MAQLIKLQDYISRYEIDFYRYPGHFIRMKKESWAAFVDKWEDEQLLWQDMQEDAREKAKFRFQKWFRKPKDIQVEEDMLFTKQEQTSTDEIKQKFLDYLFPFQLKWASSTLYESSFLDKKYHHDEVLKFFLQRFPDNIFLMYYPVFQLQNAVVDSDIILITPLEVTCLSILNFDEDIIIIPDEGRTWYIEKDDIQTKIISPMISLKRTESIVKSIFKQQGVSIPIKKIVLAKDNQIRFSLEPYLTEFIGKDQYTNWFNQLRNIHSPLKHIQLKAGHALLKYCLTTAVRRPEWELGEDEEEDDLFPFKGGS
jgi:hypothetical protein